MTCPSCGSDNVAINTFEKTNRRGCLMILLHIILTFATCGLWLIFILIKGKSSQVKTLCVCKNCGRKWNI